MSHNVITEEALARTFRLEYCPNCPSPFLVRLCGEPAKIDGLPIQQTKDCYGYGKTFDEAFKVAKGRYDEKARKRRQYFRQASRDLRAMSGGCMDKS